MNSNSMKSSFELRGDESTYPFEFLIHKSETYAVVILICFPSYAYSQSPWK